MRWSSRCNPRRERLLDLWRFWRFPAMVRYRLGSLFFLNLCLFGAWYKIRTTLEFFHHSCASSYSYHPHLIVSICFCSRCSFRWSEFKRILTHINFPLGQELAIHRGLGDFLLFAPRDSLITGSANREGIISLRGKKKPVIYIIYIFTRLTISLSSFWVSLSAPSFYQLSHLFFRRRSSTWTSEEIQQPLVVVLPIWISHPERQKTVTELCSYASYGGVFWNLFVFQDRWDMGTWGRSFEENGETQLRRSLLTFFFF